MKDTGRSICVKESKDLTYWSTATLSILDGFIGQQVELRTGVKVRAMMDGTKRVQLHPYRPRDFFHSPHHPRAHQPDSQVSPLHDL